MHLEVIDRSSHPPALVSADKTCDRTPIIGTLSNLINLLQKCFILPFASNLATKYPYMKHLKAKTFTQCLLLLIPIIGQAIIFFYNIYKEATVDPNLILEKLQQGTLYLEKCPRTYQEDTTYALIALQRDPENIKGVHPSLKRNSSFMLDAIGINPSFYNESALELREDPTFTLEALKRAHEYRRSPNIYDWNIPQKVYKNPTFSSAYKESGFRINLSITNEEL